MGIYPVGYDDDTTIIRIDNNITEIGGDSINQLRDAVFKIEKTLGLNPQGSVSTVLNRLNQSLNQDGTIKASALTSIGLVTLPIDDAQVGSNAGIKETKLSLDYKTADLYALISSNTTLLNSLVSFANLTNSNLLSHISGAQLLSDGSPARHVASHIDLNAVPSDVRDMSYSWTGLFDKNGQARAATHLASALLEINDDFVSHQNATANAHVATAISVDTSNFIEIPVTSTDVQSALEAIDQFEVINVGLHRAISHANAIPDVTRSQAPDLPDGYSSNVVPSTSAITYLVHAANTSPVDNLGQGDDLIRFNPTNTGFVFDAQFSQVKPGDIVRVNYGNGIEASFTIDSMRHIPGSEWVIRINGINLFDSANALARIDRPQYDKNTQGVLALAAANPTPTGSFALMGSLIAGHPRGASAIGIGFDANQLDASHYKLYLELYPTGNPADRIISLPYIDVTGNAGVTPGRYTVHSVVHETNSSLREIGYNYRFIAFERDGNFGIMLADCINNVSFAIISGTNSAGTLVPGVYTENVIGDSVDNFDALGLGQNHAAVASPAYQATFTDSTAALIPTKVIPPLKQRYYIVNGVRKDDFAPTYLANDDGYWDGYISSRTEVGGTTVEVTYSIQLDLGAAGLKEGKTIVVQPAVSFSDPLYSDVDYGRFIIKDINFSSCPGYPDQTYITVINGIHGTGHGFSLSSAPPLPVRIYFSEDSISFNRNHIINSVPGGTQYKRFHEIFINDKGETFSHERGAIPIQAESSTLLGTDNWHIEKVSPKLRGYRDSSTDFRYYVRFYVLTYDATTGEYTGYIGRRDPATTAITSVGPITTGHKSVVSRFYDETYVDYIDLIFEESIGGTPGSSILSTASGRYVDIELFSSFQTDDEFMPIGTCELLWSNPLSGDYIQRVRDIRQFGSVDEVDFTDSAIDFITAGDRALHENGVIRGLSLDYVNPSDNREIFFKGGVALVNGYLKYVNNQSVTIPEIWPEGTAKPQDVTWAVCVNESGNLEPIALTSTPDESYFTADGVTAYYLPSLTFADLVNTRKDLTPIATVIATIASVTIGSDDVVDIRRFIYSEGINHTLTWASDEDKIIGHFYTFDALANWMNRYGVDGNGNNKVIVRGVFEIDGTSFDTIDFSTLTVPIVLEGDGAIFNVTEPTGFTIKENIKIRNITFNYEPTGITYSAGDKISTTQGYGCIFKAGGTSASNIEISECTFSSTLATQRTPFINLHMNKADVLENVNIFDNIFIDTANDGRQAAICLYNTGSGVSSNPAAIVNSRVSNNRCNKKQGIYCVTSISGDALSELSVLNTIIDKNICGTIGYATSAAANASITLTQAFGLIISENTCHFIGSMLPTGIVPNPSTIVYTSGTGSVIVKENTCSWIHCGVLQGAIASNESPSSLQIKDNSLFAYDSAFIMDGLYEPRVVIMSGSDVSEITWDSAIYIYTNSTSMQIESCNICGNNINRGIESSYLYSNGIKANTPSIISQNNIKGFRLEYVLGTPINSTGSGIVIHSLVAPAASNPFNYIVTNNIISRNNGGDTEQNINAYIAGSSTSILNTGLAIVKNNIFDDFTVNGSDTDVIKNRGPNWTAIENKNQTETLLLEASNGAFYIDGIIAGNTSSSYVYNNYTGMGGAYDALAVEYAYVSSGSKEYFEWSTHLNSVLPYNVKIIQVSTTAKWKSAPGAPTTDNAAMILRSATSAIAPEADPIYLTYKALTTTAVSFVINPSRNWINTNANDICLLFLVQANNVPGSTYKAQIQELLITYRW